MMQQITLELDVDDGNLGCSSSLDDAFSAAKIELENLQETIYSIDALGPSCDKLDYALAACSGALCGLIDIFLVAKPGESPIGSGVDKWFENRVIDFARFCRWDGTDRASALRYLEKKFDIPYDQTGLEAASSVFGLSPNSHHFKSLGHNPTLLGLFFSILDQFSIQGKPVQSHFVTEGKLISLQVADESFELRGKNMPAKLFCGFANWLGHLISDVSGSSSTKGRGIGIPAPFLAWANDIIVIKEALHIPTAEFDKNLCQLAQSIFQKGFDIRFLTTQTVPVFVNELSIRLMYSIRRMVKYLGSVENEKKSFSKLWSACEPFSNPTIKRMLTVAHGSFCVLDTSDAIIRATATGAGTFNTCEFFLRLNVVGVGRFTISLYGETKRLASARSTAENAKFAQREKAIIENYLQGLLLLADLYDDSRLLSFIDDFKSSEMYMLAFEKSTCLAELRAVPLDKILKSKKDIDVYFAGGER